VNYPISYCCSWVREYYGIKIQKDGGQEKSQERTQNPGTTSGMRKISQIRQAREIAKLQLRTKTHNAKPSALLNPEKGRSTHKQSQIKISIYPHKTQQYPVLIMVIFLIFIDNL
jgi:hypothetical protein